jgi:hypothetical protein
MTKKRKRKKSQTLEPVYRQYNRLYFGGKLPDINVRYGKPAHKAGGETDFWGGDPVLVTINKRYRGYGRITRIILLHEMVHVSLPVDALHGPRHQKGLMRLVRLGAYADLL